MEKLRKLYTEKLERFNTIKDDVSVDIAEVRELNSELKDLKERISLAEEERELERQRVLETNEHEVRTVEPDKIQVRDLSPEQLDREYEQTFLRAFRKQPLTERDYAIYDRLVEERAVPNATPYMQTAVNEDGGFIVPHSVSTKINEYKRQGQFDLTTLVDVEMTSVLSGEFTYQTLADAKPMRKLKQWDEIPEGETPQFERKKYSIEDYAEIIPLPRTLLQDTDQNLLNVIAKWIAIKTLVTRNAEILNVINTTYGAGKKKIVNVDDVKDVLALELDPAFLPNTTVVTNEYGFNYLDKLKDANGKYLLEDDVKVPGRKLIQGRPVLVITSKTLPNLTAKKAPIYIGDFKEAVRFYDRGVYEVTPTTIGGDSFKRNSLDTRVIDRFDVIALDPEAIKAGEIDFTQLPKPGTDGTVGMTAAA